MMKKLRMVTAGLTTRACTQLWVMLITAAMMMQCAKEEEVAPGAKPVNSPKPIIFAAVSYGTVKDAEGNSYKTIAVGNQTWMAENLRATLFADGSPIPTNLTQAEWTSATSSAFCNYDDNSANTSLYGSLYNQFVIDDPRKVCPAGWHIPSPEDWNKLANQLDGIEGAGKKMKETGTTHWLDPNTGDNDSGFTALPGGSRYRGRFLDMGTDSYWWSSDTKRFFYVTNNLDNLRTKATAAPDDGLAIRCVKD